MNVAVGKGQQNQVTGNEGNDKWLTAFPQAGELRDKGGEDEDQYICFTYVCKVCGYPTLEKREYEPRKGRVGKRSDLITIAPQSRRLTEDKQLNNACNEAYDCYSIKAYRATVIIARSIIENLINELIKDEQFKIGSDGKKYDRGLKEKIEIAKKKYIPEVLKDKLLAIKLLGDSSTHNIVRRVSQKDAKAVIDLLEPIVKAYDKDLSKQKQVTATAEGIRISSRDIANNE